MRFQNFLLTVPLTVSIVSAAVPTDTGWADGWNRRVRPTDGSSALSERFRKADQRPDGEWRQTQAAANACLEYNMWRELNVLRPPGAVGFDGVVKRCRRQHMFTPQISAWLEKELQKAADSWAEGWDPTQETYGEMKKKERADPEAYIKKQDKLIEHRLGKKPTRVPGPEPVSKDSNDASKISNDQNSIFSSISSALSRANKDSRQHMGVAVPWKGGSPAFQRIQVPRPMGFL